MKWPESDSSFPYSYLFIFSWAAFPAELRSQGSFYQTPLYSKSSVAAFLAPCGLSVAIRAALASPRQVVNNGPDSFPSSRSRKFATVFGATVSNSCRNFGCIHLPLVLNEAALRVCRVAQADPVRKPKVPNSSQSSPNAGDHPAQPGTGKCPPPDPKHR
jgi:hypothetical protein